MTMTIGGVDIPADEQPDQGAYPFVRQQRWVSHSGVGLTGSVQQLMGTDPLKFRLHFTASQATLDDLQALYDAQSSGGGPYAFVQDELPEPYATGFDVVMQTFMAEVAEVNRGVPWFDTWIDFEEVV